MPILDIFKKKDTKASEITKKVNFDKTQVARIPVARIKQFPGIFGGIKPQKGGGQYQESGREVYLNGGSRANTVYYKGGGKEAYVRVGGGFVNLDKNFEKNS
jgi:hypothetical protein